MAGQNLLGTCKDYCGAQVDPNHLLNLTTKFENFCAENDTETSIKYLEKFSVAGVNLEEEVASMLKRKEQVKERKEKEAEAEKEREADGGERPKGRGKGRGRGRGGAQNQR